MAVIESSKGSDQIVHSTLAEALAAFQGECPQVRKTSTAKVTGKSRDGNAVSYQYGFADLSSIHEIIDPIKGKHGLSFSSRPTMAGDRFILEYVLRHTSGDSVTGSWPLGDPLMNPQEMGKLITYYRRYAECAVLGVAPGGDDDGGEHAPKRREEQPDWAEVLGQAVALSTLPELRMLYARAGVKRAPEDVREAFQARVAEVQSMAPAEQAEPGGQS